MSHSVELLRKDATHVPEVRSPTVRRRELGALLRALRIQKGFTVEQAAGRLLFSMSKLSRMETGHGVATPRDIRDLCDLYGVTDEAERERMMQLARESKQQGWWQSYDLDFDTYVGLEADAIAIRRYQSTIIPGLLQTRDYARVVHEVVIPRLSRERVDELVEVRMMRQQLLTQNPAPGFWVVLDEAVLHRVVGGPVVMSAQLDRLIEVTKLPNVTIQIVPYDAGAHPAMDSAFSMLDFASSVASVVYVEGLVGWIYVDNPRDLVRYRQVFERLCAIALTPQESIELIARVGAQHKGASTLRAHDADVLVDGQSSETIEITTVNLKASVKDIQCLWLKKSGACLTGGRPAAVWVMVTAWKLPQQTERSSFGTQRTPVARHWSIPLRRGGILSPRQGWAISTEGGRSLRKRELERPGCGLGSLTAGRSACAALCSTQQELAAVTPCLAALANPQR
jgi:transcriptional regulator with XRE-family HTH domain